MNVQSTEPFFNGKYLFKVNTTDNIKRCPEAILVSLIFKLNMLFFFCIYTPYETAKLLQATITLR